MALNRVDFICPKCQMFCKPEHPKVQVDKTETFVQYGHTKCYTVEDDN